MAINDKFINIFNLLTTSNDDTNLDSYFNSILNYRRNNIIVRTLLKLEDNNIKYTILKGFAAENRYEACTVEYSDISDYNSIDDILVNIDGIIIEKLSDRVTKFTVK